MSEQVGVRVSVPLASFRVPFARELLESYAIPPPATIYGMLLSYIGEPWRQRHAGARIAYAMLSKPERSTVLRTAWRIKSSSPPGVADNRRPDFQQLYSPIELAIWVRPGLHNEGTDGHFAETPLVDRLERGLDSPETIDRFGALCLGESTHLVDDFRRLRANEPGYGQLIVPDSRGSLNLPIWPDHVGAATTWGRFSLRYLDLGMLDDDVFVTVEPKTRGN